MTAIPVKRRQGSSSDRSHSYYLGIASMQQPFMEMQMKLLITKIALASSVALGALVAAEGANAQIYAQRNQGEVYDSQANPNYGFGPRTTVRPGDAISGNRVIGRDPDPFVRDQLLREFNSGRPD